MLNLYEYCKKNQKQLDQSKTMSGPQPEKESFEQEEETEKQKPQKVRIRRLKVSNFTAAPVRDNNF